MGEPRTNAEVIRTFVDALRQARELEVGKLWFPPDQLEFFRSEMARAHNNLCATANASGIVRGEQKSSLRENSIAPPSGGLPGSDAKSHRPTSRFRTVRASLSESRRCIGKPLPAAALTRKGYLAHWQTGLR
jgi:hypothetical protein